MKVLIILVCFLVVIVAVSIFSGVIEHMDVETSVYVQKQMQNVGSDVKATMLPVAGQINDLKAKNAYIDRQYTTMSESLSSQGQTQSSMLVDIQTIKSQMAAAQSTGIDVSAMKVQLASLESQVNALTSDGIVDSISQATINISNKTNSQLSQMPVMMDDKIKTYNDALQMRSLEGRNSMQILSNDNQNFVIIDTSSNYATVVSRAQNTQFEIGQVDSITGNDVEVDVIIDGLSKSYHSVGLGKDGTTFIGMREVEGDMIINNNNGVTQISTTHVFAIPQAYQNMSNMPEMSYSSILSIDEGGVHMPFHDVVSTATGLQICKKDQSQCTSIL